MDQPTATVVTITPAMAAEWLSTSQGNRPIYKQTVERYARAMRANEWIVNGEALHFDTDGHLLNGHHRLQACIKADTPFPSMVVRGLPAKAFDTFDSGKVRNQPDTLAIAGEQYSNILAPALQLLWRHERGILNSTLSASSRELMAVLARHPQSRSSITSTFHKPAIVPLATLAFVHCVATEKGDGNAADLFAEAVRDGINLEATNAARLLREKVLATRGRAVAKLTRATLLALTIKAYNYFSASEPLTYLKWSPMEPFPVFGEISKATTKLRTWKDKRKAATAVLEEWAP